MSASAAAPAAAETHSCLSGADGSEAIEGVLELSDPFALFHGGHLPGVRIAWRLAGTPGTPVVAALGGISAHRVVFSDGATSGWWDALVGPGGAVDTRRCRVLGLDFLGGSARSTRPIPGQCFPSVSTFDQAAALAHVLDHLGITSLHAIVGASYGGMVALAFAQHHAHLVERLIVISAAHRAYPMATAWRCVQRTIVRRALASGEGRCGLQVARALAMATYRSGEEFSARFSATVVRDDRGRFRFPVEDYLLARGASYAASYSPEAFLCLSESIDLHSVDPAGIHTPTLLIGVRQDQLVPPADLAELAERLGPHARRLELSSSYGHDAFLKESVQLTPHVRGALFESSPGEIT